jgi:hypothetical protein
VGGFAVLWIMLSSIQAAAGDADGATCFLAAALLFAAILWKIRPGVGDSLADTERANREVAARAGLVRPTMATCRSV